MQTPNRHAQTRSHPSTLPVAAARRKLSGKRTALDVCLCRPAAEEAEAVVLDMGEYEGPTAYAMQLKPTEPVPSLPQLQALRNASGGAGGVRNHWPAGAFLPGALAEERSPAGGAARRAASRVRLIQICAPPILARAKVRRHRRLALL
jgi:hypothetical protein